MEDSKQIITISMSREHVQWLKVQAAKRSFETGVSRNYADLIREMIEAEFAKGGKNEQA